MMTVDKKRKTSCEWCGSTTNNYDGVFSEITDGTYCSEGCKDEAIREARANCDHFTAVNIRVVEGVEYGICEDCGAEVKHLNEKWEET